MVFGQLLTEIEKVNGIELVMRLFLELHSLWIHFLNNWDKWILMDLTTSGSKCNLLNHMVD